MMTAEAPASTFRLAQEANARMDAALAAQRKRPWATIWLGVVFGVLLVAAGVLALVYLHVTGPERAARETLVGTWDEVETYRSRDGETATTDTFLAFTSDGLYKLYMDGELAQDGEWFLLERDGTSCIFACPINSWEYLTFTVDEVDGRLQGSFTLFAQDRSSSITKTFRKVSGDALSPEAVTGS